MASLTERPLIALVGGDTLLAKEIREVLGESNPVPRVQLISASGDGTAKLAAEDDEPIVMAPLSAESLTGATVAFLAGSPASSRRALKVNPAGGPRLIDLAGGLEEQPEARLRAPSADPALWRPEGIASPIQVIAHPAAIALAMFLGRVSQAARIRRSVVHVFEPASERGQRGLDELQKQTVNLFAFKPLPKTVFDAQVSFNLLPAWGADAPQSLGDVELRIERHLASLLGPGSKVPMPSLRLIQAPVFHGYSFSLWALFDAPPEPDRIAAELASANIDVRSGDQEPPANAGIAGQSGIVVGSMMKDRNQPQACWFWMAADNLRMSADNCVEVIREVVG